MSQQLTIQQLEHAIANIEKRVEAKKLELESYAELRDCAQAVLADLLDSAIIPAPAYHDRARLAVTNCFASKHATATVDLEELQLNLAAMKTMRSGVVGANMVIPPFNSKRN